VRDIDEMRLVNHLLINRKVGLTALTPAAEVLLLELFEAAHPGTWLVDAADYALTHFDPRHDRELFDRVVELYDFDMSQRDGLHLREFVWWPPELPERARAIPLMEVPHEQNIEVATGALNLIADADARSGHLLRLLHGQWRDFLGHRSFAGDLGEFLDAYTAAVDSGPGR
jgi:hypothetical protein